MWNCYATSKLEVLAEEHFNKDADNLSANECALIAATLPNPRKFNSAHPSRYMKKRQAQIRRLMRLVPQFPEKKD